MITISIYNDDVNDLFVSIRDFNTAGHNVVIDQIRINSGDNIPVSIQEDGNGNGHIQWAAIQVSDPNKTKQVDVPDVNPNSTVDVDVFGV